MHTIYLYTHILILCVYMYVCLWGGGEGGGCGCVYALATAGSALAGHGHGPKCPGCNGWGSLRSTRKKEFYVPPGAEEGMRAAVDFTSQGEVHYKLDLVH
jgi:hypothetical protein